MTAVELTRLQRATYRVWLAVGVVLLGGATLWLLARPLAVVVPPLLVALILVYILNPIVTLLHRLWVPRLVGTLLAFALFAGAITGLGILLTPLLIEQIQTFSEVAPELWTDLTDQFGAWLANLGLNVDLAGTFDAEVAAEQLQDLLADAQGRDTAIALLGGLGGLFSSVFTFALALVVGPFIAAYLLWDLPRVRAWATQAVPPHRRDEVTEVARRLSRVVGGFIRGQLIVAVYVGVATSIGLAIIGLPFWLVIGVIAGVTNVVPLIGPFVAGLLGVLVALFVDGVGLAIAVVIVMTIVQQGDNQIVSPIVMGRTVRLHPLVVLLALLVAGVLYGIPGLVVSVPLVAAGNVLLSHFWRTRVPWAAPAGAARSSSGGDDDTAPSPSSHVSSS